MVGVTTCIGGTIKGRQLKAGSGGIGGASFLAVFAPRLQWVPVPVVISLLSLSLSLSLSLKFAFRHLGILLVSFYVGGVHCMSRYLCWRGALHVAVLWWGCVCAFLFFSLLLFVVLLTL